VKYKATMPSELKLKPGVFDFSRCPVTKSVVTLTTLLILACQVSSAEPIALGQRIATAARQQIGVTKEYDPAYVSIAYPGGDVPMRTGVCCDVVVRAIRKVGIDLQKEVHEDMRKNFSAYPQKWGLTKPDANIDHRRVPNLMRYFERHHIILGEKLKMKETYHAGDIVAWELGNGLLHIGIVSDKSSAGTPLIIHNIGRGAQEEDILFKYNVIGHYRIKQPPQKPGI
jgi:uncharacterized protein YijF (DUF1287 family)